MAAIAEELRRDVGRAKWHVWHGNLPAALDLLTYTSFGFDACTDNEARTKSVRLLNELAGYLDRNRATIRATPNATSPANPSPQPPPKRP